MTTGYKICEECYEKKTPEGGWCYMYESEPKKVNECRHFRGEVKKAIPSSDGLCPTHVGIDLASGPDRTVMKCACGWYGEPKDMTANKSGIRTCPDCGASGGVVGA